MWEKISAYHISDKGLVPRIYHNYYVSTIKRPITQLKKMSAGFEYTSLQRNIQMASKANEKMFNISNERQANQNQNETKFILTRMARIKF